MTKSSPYIQVSSFLAIILGIKHTHACTPARTHTHTHTHIHTTHLTVISLKMQTPQKREAKAPGPVVMMGKATGSDSTLLAMNQHPVATAHMMPEAMAGRITLGYT